MCLINRIYISPSLVIHLENLCKVHILLIMNQFQFTMNLIKGNFRLINSYMLI